MLACALFGCTVTAQVSSQKSINLVGAQKVITAAEAEARRSGGTAVIAVVDAGGNLMALQRLDGHLRRGCQHFDWQSAHRSAIQEADQVLRGHH